jgi:hypothetical protein
VVPVTTDDKVFGLIIVTGLALCAYACVPRGNAFPTFQSRLQWGLFFFLAFLGAFAAFSWEKISTLWNS